MPLTTTGKVPPGFERFIDTEEAAKSLGIHKVSLLRLIAKRRVKTIKFAGRHLIDLDWFEQFKATYLARPGRRSLDERLF